MKIIKILRYPIILLAVILVPASLATVFLDLPTLLEQQGWLTNPDRWHFISSLGGYGIGYLLIYELMRGINKLFDAPIYSKRMRTTYLITNAIVALLLLGLLGYSISLIYTEQPLTFTYAVIFIGFPWVSVQMLLLLFFVRSESLYQ